MKIYDLWRNPPPTAFGWMYGFVHGWVESCQITKNFVINGISLELIEIIQ